MVPLTLAQKMAYAAPEVSQRIFRAAVREARRVGPVDSIASPFFFASPDLRTLAVVALIFGTETYASRSLRLSAPGRNGAIVDCPGCSTMMLRVEVELLGRP
jgi:hypothetical protein